MDQSKQDSRFAKKLSRRNRSLCIEPLEERILNTVAGLDGMLVGLLSQAPERANSVLASSATTAPTFSLTGASTTNATSSQLSVSSVNASAISGLKYTWSVVRSPSGGKITFAANGSAAASVNTLSFNKSGNYTVQVAIEGTGLAVRNITKDINVTPSLTSFAFYDTSGKPLTLSTAIAVNARNYSFSVRGLDQFGNAMATPPTLSWTASALPNNSNFSVVASGGDLTACFNKVGQYRLVARSGTLPTKEVTFNVVPTITFVSASEPNGAAIRTQSPLEITSGTFRATAFAIDQFGDRLAQQPRINWVASSATAGSSVKSTVDSNSVLFEFSKSGRYTLKAQYGDIQLSITANVTVPAKVLSSLKVSQSAVTILPGKSISLSAQALDQFESQLATQPSFNWTATGGTLTTSSSTSTATFVAGNQAGNFTITVRAGNLSKLIAVQILANIPVIEQIKTPALANLVRDLYRDSQLSRTDVIGILRSTTTDGVVDASEYLDLKTIFATTTSYVMPSYVSTLARNVVGTNPANRNFQGSALGDLQAGSSAVVMNHLIDKWFLGADLPTTTNPSYSYTYATGQLFSGTPSHSDTRQGMLGDCYLISGFGALADSNPDAVRNMFIDNGDGTYTVRFYSSMGNGQTAGTADYVTVNRQLPTDSRGLLVYANSSAYATDRSLSLWIALAEKAYAQWNETGKEGRDGTNRYSAINGGNSYYVFGQVLGYEASNFSFIDSNKQTLISALNSHKAVVLGTNVTVSTPGLVGCHGYMVTGYNAGTDTFSAYNPWGYAHPSPLTWAQLKKDGGGFTIADTSFTISTVLAQAPSPTVRSMGAEFTPAVMEIRLVILEDHLDRTFSGSHATTTFVPSALGPLAVEDNGPLNSAGVLQALEENQVPEESVFQQADLIDAALLALLSSGDLL